MHNGFDVFFCKPGRFDSMICVVCGTQCIVERNVTGSTSFAGAMAGRKSLHDRFICPHSGMEWHEDVIKLTKEVENTASKRIKALIVADINDILDKYLPNGPLVEK